jgi:16S rRNA (cytosine1402-N4)-methyltransferase
VGRHGKTHPATRIFLALRAVVNQEEVVLKDLLEQAPSLLKVGGRLAIISFQGIEDKLVKEKFRLLAAEGCDGKCFSLVYKKPVLPTESEQEKNPRSRSAKLRVLERVS